MTASPVQNQIYAGWLYAAVSNTDGSLFGIFMTKDFGQNWVRVRIPTEPRVGSFTPAIPSSDIGLGDYNVTNGAGNFDITMAIDPTNPNIIYVGGYNAPATGTGMIRVDTTKIWDAHNLTLFSAAAAGGAIDLSSTGPVTIGAYQNGWFTPGDYLNFIRDPNDPFNANSTLFVRNLVQFTNNGFGTEWIPFDAPMPFDGTSPSYHRLITMVDPTTGLTRLVFGTNRGVWSVLDDDGVQLYGSSVGTMPTPGETATATCKSLSFSTGPCNRATPPWPPATTMPCSTPAATTAGLRPTAWFSRPANCSGSGPVRGRRLGEWPRISKAKARVIRHSSLVRCRKTWEPRSSA